MEHIASALMKHIKGTFRVVLHIYAKCIRGTLQAHYWDMYKLEVVWMHVMSECRCKSKVHNEYIRNRKPTYNVPLNGLTEHIQCTF